MMRSVGARTFFWFSAGYWVYYALLSVVGAFFFPQLRGGATLEAVFHPGFIVEFLEIEAELLVTVICATLGVAILETRCGRVSMNPPPARLVERSSHPVCR